jgi:hypothetical protein
LTKILDKADDVEPNYTDDGCIQEAEKDKDGDTGKKHVISIHIFVHIHFV